MAIRTQVSRLQDLVQLVRTDAPVASTTEALVRLGATFSGGDADGTYIGINAPSGYTGNLVHFAVNASVKCVVGEDGRFGLGTGLSGTNFGNLSSAHTNVSQARTLQSTGVFTQNSGSTTVFGNFITQRLIPSSTSDLVGVGMMSQPLYEGTPGVTQSGIYGYRASLGLNGVSPTGTITEWASFHADVVTNAATGTPVVTVTNRYGMLIPNQATGHGVNGLTLTNTHAIRISNQTGAGTLSRAITVDGGANYFSSGATTVVPLTLDVPSGTANFLDCRVAGGVVGIALKQAMTLGVGFIERPTVSTGTFIDVQQAISGTISVINRTTASNKVFVAKGMASQSGNLYEAQNANAGALYSITSAGDLTFNRTSSTTEGRQIASFVGIFATATDASRKGRLSFNITDTADREAMCIEASGSAAMISFLGAVAVVRQVVTGSRGGNAALASFLTALATFGLITDSTTA